MRISVVSFTVGGRVTRADIPGLCAELAEVLRGRSGDLVICDVADVAEPDAVTVEALARLRVTASRYGSTLVVSGAGPRLLQLVRLFGLTAVLPQMGRQTEQREQARGIEEVVDGGDPPV